MRWLLALTMLVAVGCGDGGTPGDPVVDSQTHWMEACTSSEECGDLTCSCGVCTTSCDDAAACGELGPAVCGEVCGESAAVCLPTCGVFGDCAAFGSHLSCVAGRCVPDTGPDPDVGVDVADVPDVEDDVDATPDEPCILEPGLEAIEDTPEASGAPRTASGGDVHAWVDRSLGRAHLAVARGAESWRGPQPVGGVALVAAAGAENIGLAWVENGSRVLFARLEAASGTWLGPVEVASVEDGGLGDVQIRETVDGFAVAWTFEREECCPANLQISFLMQRVGQDGVAVGGAVELVSGTDIVRDPAWVTTEDGFAVVWVAASTSDVRARRFDAAGLPLAEAVVVSGDGAVPAEPSIAAKPGELVVAWGDRRGNAERPEIFLARVGEPEIQVTIDGKDSRWPAILAVGEGYALVWMDQLPVRVPSGVSAVNVGPDLSRSAFVQLASMDAAGGGLSATWDGEAISVGFHSVGPAGAGGQVLAPRRLRGLADGTIVTAETALVGPAATPSGVAIAVGETVRGIAWLDGRSVSNGTEPLFATWDDTGQVLAEVTLGPPGGATDSLDVAAVGDSFGIVYAEAGAIYFQVSGIGGPAVPPLVLREAGAGVLQLPQVAANGQRFGVVWAEGDGDGTLEFREVSVGGQPLGTDSAPFGDGGARIAILGETDGFRIAWTHRLASQLWTPGSPVESFAHALDAVPAGGGIVLLDEEAVVAELPAGSVTLPIALGDWVSVELAGDGWRVVGSRAAVEISPAGELSELGRWPDAFVVEDAAGGFVANAEGGVQAGPFQVECP